jgi:prolyl 4-hydroxylase
VLSYQPGQEYKLHSDALPHDLNPRVLTLLVYLNSDYRGGETEFPRAGIRYRGRPGDALVFDSVTRDGVPDPAAWHAGLPVAAGRKLLLSKWIRKGALDLAGPSGRPF